MTSSIITQKRIAKAFKIVLRQTDLESVTISKLMKEADMRRQTFYDYFLDKYDLVNWIFQQEFTEIIADNIGYQTWDAILRQMVDYFEENRNFYLKVLSYDGQNSFKRFSKEQNHNLVELFMNPFPTLAEQSSNPKPTQEGINEALFNRILTNALVETITEWIHNDCQTPAEDLSNHLIYFLQHYRPIK